MRDDEGSRGSAVRRADKYPLILQVSFAGLHRDWVGPSIKADGHEHNGHSRTVVGYEETSRGDVNLLMFDPGK